MLLIKNIILFEEYVDIVGSEDATTCHIVILSHTGMYWKYYLEVFTFHDYDMIKRLLNFEKKTEIKYFSGSFKQNICSDLFSFHLNEAYLTLLSCQDTRR